MKTLGITRRIDGLGRIVIPKEIRRKLHLNYGDLFEIYINDTDSITLKKYSLLSENKKIISNYIKLLAKKIDGKIMVTDLKEVVFSSDSRLENKVANIINLSNKSDDNSIELLNNYVISKPYKIYPINPNGDLIGYLIFDLKKSVDENFLLFSKEYIVSQFECN